MVGVASEVPGGVEAASGDRLPMARWHLNDNPADAFATARLRVRRRRREHLIQQLEVRGVLIPLVDQSLE